ncbi:MAG: OadG family protein [Chloroflexi bacterium]|nr:OadG family protein [Chloroflexota bacterium]
MVDFDISKAVTLTILGVGAAFVSLVSLIILTRLMSRIVGTAPQDQAEAIAGTAADALAQAVDETTGVAPGQNPAMAAAAAAAVAMAEEEFDAEAMALEEMEHQGPAPEAAGWKSYGRWQLMASRMAMQSRRATRRGR